ncbi:unnamed protein product, partial [Closterium sp. NIES-53]
MDIARTSMIHAREPHFRWPYALLYAAHQLNLKPRVSRPEVSPTSLWTGSPGVGSAFHVLGCLALVRDTSADKLSARHPRCLPWFPGGLSDYSFYHPPLHQFLDSRDVRFDKSMSYYTRYPCRGLPAPPPPLFLAPSPPPAPAPPSLQQPSALPRQVTVDSVDVGAEGAATGSTRSGGARSRGAGAGGAGAGGASLKGVGSGGSGTGGVSSGGTGAGGARTGGASSGGAGVGGTGTGVSECYSAYICVGYSGVAHKGLRVASCFMCAAPCSLRTAFLQPACSPPLRCLASARPACCAAMASLRVLVFDHEGHPIQFDTWLDDLQLYLLSDSRDNVSLFDHTSGATPAPPATADSATRSQDHFLELDPTALTVDLLEQHLLAAETSVVAVGAARGTPLTPFFEGCFPSPLAPSYASTAAADVPSAADVGAASASAKCRSSKGKGGRGGGGGSGGGGGGSSGGGGGSGGGGSGGSGGGSGVFGGGGGGSGGGGSGGSGGGRTGAQRGGYGGGQRQQQQRRSETPSPQQLREWFARRGT